MNSGGQKVPTPPECALAAEMFDHFCSAGTMKQILTLHREICDTLNLKPNRLPDFYPKLKAKLASSWKAQALFKKFDARANHKVYAKGRACSQNKVLLIGAGPCGLRAAIECQLLGAKVVVIEKRDRFSRNNVLHLWPFVIHDLRALGAKKFFGKFCAGAIDHISIRQLQCILMKVSLLLGVEIHEGVSFEELLEPTGTESSATLGWRARVDPAEHPVSQYEFDALIGADGKRNTLQGFKRKEFRGKLAMAITANFINRHTEQEASVPEISGVAFIFNQKFFKELYEVTRIDLENIVYYKDDTHYFVMTAKKHSLLEKGVLVNDFADVTRLLSVENVDRSSLMKYAQEAARFSTDGRLPLKDFALNHYGEPDVALFDFTSMYAAENASIVYERHGRRLLCQLVGDSLLEPFWPTGSGCARGFLSALDAAWAVRTWGHTPQPHPLQVIAERESIYRLLAQTTPENLHRDFGAYTLDPGTRYPNLNRTAVTPHRVTSFYDSDDPLPLDAANSARKRRREPEISEDALLSWVKHFEPGIRAAVGPVSLCNLLRRYRPDLMPPDTPPRLVYQILQQEFGISPLAANGPTRETPDAKLRSYLLRVYHAFKGEVPHIYHKTDMFRQIKQSQQKENILSTVDHPVSAYTNTAEAEKSHSSHRKKRRSLRSQEEGRVVGGGARTVGGGARVARLAAELSNTSSGGAVPKASKPKDLMRSVGKIERDDWNVKEIERKIMENRLGRPEPKTAEKVPKWDREQFLGRQRRLKEGDSNEEKWGEIDETLHKLDQKLRDSGRPDHGTKKVANLATKFIKKDEPETSKTSSKEELKRTWRGPSSAGMQCASCGTRVFAAEAVTADGLHLHRSCFRCAVCKAVLRPGNYTMERYGSRLVCLRHSGVSVPDSLSTKVTRLDTLATPERISLEMSDGGAREIDEDEWTDRNFLASETSGAGGLSDEEDSSSEEFTDAMCSEEADDSPEPELQNTRPAQTHLYFSDDSFGYDDYSEEGAVSSGNESCSRMREAREARRREVPAEPRPPTYSSEMESEEDSESSEDEVSSATEVSTDSEFAREECAPATTPPAILVTEAAPVAPVAAPVPVAPVAPTAPQDYPLSRTRSAGGLATKRALELKRKYLLGEPSPPSVKKSDSTSQLDTKLEAFRCNITEFQKLLNPAPIQPVTEQISVTMQMATTQSNEEPESDQSLPAKITQEPEDIASQKDRKASPIELVSPKPIRTLRVTTGYKKVPMPDIISNLFPDAPLDLLEQGLSPFYDPVLPAEEGNSNLDHLGIDSDSLSEDDSSINQRLSNQSVPRVEVHDEGGELIQLDSLTIANNINDSKDDKIIEATNTTALSAVCVDSESSDSNKDVTTLALTETELSDWAAESAVLDECGFEEKDDRKRNKNPRTLSEPKMVHETKNISAIASHICGKTSPTEHIVFSNALEHFEFADEGDQDPSIESPATPKNEGYMELVDDYYGHYSPTNDRSMNFIERTFSETTIKPTVLENEEVEVTNDNDEIKFIDDQDSKSDAVSKNDSLKSTGEFRKLFGDSPSHSMSNGNGNEDENSVGKTEHLSAVIKEDNNSPQTISDSVSISDISPPLENDDLASKTSACKSENSNDKASLEDISPPLASEKSKSHNSLLYQKAQKPITFASPCSIRLYAPAICRSASETFGRLSKNGNVSPRYNDWGASCHVSPGSISPGSGTSVLGPDSVDRIQVIQKERQEQTDLVKRLVLERLGNGQRVIRKTARRQRMSPVCSAPPPVPPPPVLATPPSPPPPPRPRPPPAALMSLPVVSSFSDPDLTQDRRRKGIMRSISNYFNRRLGPRHKCVSEPDLTTHEVGESHKSTGAFAPPVPPPPAVYSPSPAPPVVLTSSSREDGGCEPDPVERDAMQLWFEARWARLVAQRRAREASPDEPSARRLARLQKRLSRPLPAEEQAATVAELVQVSAQRDAHRALMAADRRRTSSRNRAGD